jgi:hypothetical protein
MVKLRRIERVTHFTHNGKPVALVEAHWFVLAGGRDRGVGFSYRSPKTVAADGQASINIRDYVMLARLTAAVVTVILVLRALKFGRRT